MALKKPEKHDSDLAGSKKQKTGSEEN